MKLQFCFGVSSFNRLVRLPSMCRGDYRGRIFGMRQICGLRTTVAVPYQHSVMRSQPLN
ncbi:hypothetical protein BC938DRAFT_482646 [Jimgerdemannia flammicorona]|uniref:Uncharacterized protein n=1 Tax=Jimgerdemannia flammicorona TaxID=994334 RepID=A0A433QDJ0_9FUNG|nr:hypothetical protein BC938DRAFT_482646 [Jimgerdemannia flammicorona]